jgi:outer membrane protein
MKNLGTILSIIALAGVIYLIVSKPSAAVSSDMPSATSTEGGLKIAYIDADTLLASYQFQQDLTAELEEKVKAIDSELGRRAQVFQNEVLSYQENAANWSEQLRMQTEQELQNIQQEQQIYREEQNGLLMVEEQRMSNLIRKDLDSIVALIKDRENLDFVFSKGGTSVMLAANPSYDITDIVLKELNEAYTAKKDANENE